MSKDPAKAYKTAYSKLDKDKILSNPDIATTVMYTNNKDMKKEGTTIKPSENHKLDFVVPEGGLLPNESILVKFI